jgi:hypothetical protein
VSDAAMCACFDCLFLIPNPSPPRRPTHSGTALFVTGFQLSSLVHVALFNLNGELNQWWSAEAGASGSNALNGLIDLLHMILGVENRTGSFVMEVHSEWVRRGNLVRARASSVPLSLMTRLRKDHGV